MTMENHIYLILLTKTRKLHLNVITIIWFVRTKYVIKLHYFNDISHQFVYLSDFTKIYFEIQI